MILVIKNSNKIWIKGHSMYADFGKDIVCSAVSSIVTTTVNGILKIDSKAIEYIVNDGEIQINILKNDDVTIKLLDNMIELLEELSHNYSKNIKIKEGV